MSPLVTRARALLRNRRENETPKPVSKQSTTSKRRTQASSTASKNPLKGFNFKRVPRRATVFVIEQEGQQRKILADRMTVNVVRNMKNRRQTSFHAALPPRLDDSPASEAEKEVTSVGADSDEGERSPHVHWPENVEDQPGPTKTPATAQRKDSAQVGAFMLLPLHVMIRSHLTSGLSSLYRAPSSSTAIRARRFPMKVLCGEGLEVVPRVLWRTRRQSSISRCLLLAFARIAGLCPVLALVLALGPEFARWVPTPIRPPACFTRLRNQLPFRSRLELSQRMSALSVVPPAPRPQRLDATIVLDPLVSI